MHSIEGPPAPCSPKPANLVAVERFARRSDHQLFWRSCQYHSRTPRYSRFDGFRRSGMILVLFQFHEPFQATRLLHCTSKTWTFATSDPFFETPALQTATYKRFNSGTNKDVCPPTELGIFASNAYVSGSFCS